MKKNKIRVFALLMALLLVFSCVATAELSAAIQALYHKNLLRRGCGDPDGASPELAPYVFNLQRDINAVYKRNICGLPDGVFGPKTETGVKQYQKDNKLTRDGVAGDKTKTKLFNDPRRKPSTT